MPLDSPGQVICSYNPTRLPILKKLVMYNIQPHPSMVYLDPNSSRYFQDSIKMTRSLEEKTWRFYDQATSRDNYQGSWAWGRLFLISRESVNSKMMIINPSMVEWMFEEVFPKKGSISSLYFPLADVHGPLPLHPGQIVLIRGIRQFDTSSVVDPLIHAMHILPLGMSKMIELLGDPGKDLQLKQIVVEDMRLSAVPGMEWSKGKAFPCRLTVTGDGLICHLPNEQTKVVNFLTSTRPLSDELPWHRNDSTINNPDMLVLSHGQRHFCIGLVKAHFNDYTLTQSLMSVVAKSIFMSVSEPELSTYTWLKGVMRLMLFQSSFAPDTVFAADPCLWRYLSMPVVPDILVLIHDHHESDMKDSLSNASFIDIIELGRRMKTTGKVAPNGIDWQETCECTVLCVAMDDHSEVLIELYEDQFDENGEEELPFWKSCCATVFRKR